MQGAPFLDTGDDYLANACSFAMSVMLVCCIMFKIGELTEIDEVWTRMAPEQREAFKVPARCEHRSLMRYYGPC